MRDAIGLFSMLNLNIDLKTIVQNSGRKKKKKLAFLSDLAQPRRDICFESIPADLDRSLRNQIDTKVMERGWYCRLHGRFRALFSQPQVCGCGAVESFGAIFDCLSSLTSDEEITRLRTIYHRRLTPLIEQYFVPKDQEILREALKTMMLLRYLDIPYRGYDLEQTSHVGMLLARLNLLCRGRDLMAWQENDLVVFTIETDHERFSAWTVNRMRYFQDSSTRGKLLSDALWSTLFSEAENERLDKWQGQLDSGKPFFVLGNNIPNREAVNVRLAGADMGLIVVFESPWPQDRGRRLQRVLLDTPRSYPKSRILIWEPRLLNPETRAFLQDYLAVGMALRYAMAQKHHGSQQDWLIRALRRKYLKTAPKALRVLTESYRQGQVVSDFATLKPAPNDEDLMETLTLVAELSR